MQRVLRAALAAAAAVALTWSLARPAAAESTNASTITQIKINEESNLAHRLYHGALWLEIDKANVTYRWGGKHCADSTISDTHIHMLYDAFRSRYVVIIEYKIHVYKQKQYRCLTGFTVSRS